MGCPGNEWLSDTTLHDVAVGHAVAPGASSIKSESNSGYAFGREMLRRAHRSAAMLPVNDAKQNDAAAMASVQGGDNGTYHGLTRTMLSATLGFRVWAEKVRILHCLRVCTSMCLRCCQSSTHNKVGRSMALCLPVACPTAQDRPQQLSTVLQLA